MRDTGSFEEKAREVAEVVVRGADSDREVWGSHVPVCSILTPVVDLDREFPKSIEGTPYYLMSRSREPIPRLIIQVSDLSEKLRAIYEVALGMMDNSYHVWR